MMMVPEKPKKLPSVALSLLPCFYFVELPLVASSLLSLYLLEMTDLLQPAALPFRCFDRSLSKPYVSGGEQLVPTLMLLSLVFSGPAASIMLVEGALYCLQLRWQRRRLAPGSCGFNAFLRRTVRFVGVHLFGLCCTALLTDVLQLCTGYPAPFFLTVCKPNYTLAGASCERQRLVSAAICSGTDQHALAAARKTFPSQHATLSAYAAVYVSMYFNSALPDGSKLLKPLLVFAFAVAAAMSGLTQITQHRSHPVDVYVGFLIGAFVAAYLALHAVSNFKSGEAPPPFPAAPLATPPGRNDPLRALTERGHQSVYSKGPASASASQDEIAAATAAALPSPPSLGAGPLRRGAGSPPPSPPSSLKRASVDVELLAPRSPMAKETMLTFGNSLPRATADDDIIAARRSVKPVQIPDSPVAAEDEEEEEEEEGSRAPLYPAAAAAVHRGRFNPRPVAPPQVPPPVSPKSALTRAKWVAIREKATAHANAASLSAASMAAARVSPPPLVLPQAPPLSERHPWDGLRGDSSFRPRRGPASSLVAAAGDDDEAPPADARRLRRKTALVLLDREGPEESPYARRYKD